MNTPAPEPAAASLPYFVLLYTPAPQRAALTALLAIGEELRAGAAHALDHGVAHARLAWWRDEALRSTRGEAQHPWLRALQAEGDAPLPELLPLVAAAEEDLAQLALAARRGTALRGAQFAAIARLLASGLDASQLGRIHALGEAVAALESAATTEAIGAVAAQVNGVERTLQPRLAPLWVWSALAVRHARRRLRQAAPGRFEAVADNLAAWRAARRAARGRFQLGAMR